MKRLTPDQQWWTAEEIAAAAMPDLPASRQGVEALAKRLDWRAQAGAARRRAGRGGGWEYHWSLLPSRAQRKLLSTVEAAVARPVADRDSAWAWFEALPDTVQAKARERLAVVQHVEALVGAGMTKFLAVHEVARMASIKPRAVWDWFAAIKPVRSDDRLPYLAPRHRAAVRKSTKTPISEDFFTFFKSDYLRPAGPSFATCYRDAVRVARNQGWDIPQERTLRRRFDAEVTVETQILARKGIDALKRRYPAQTRDKSALHAMEVVNADFHKFDVFVRWPVEPGQNEPAYVGRPQMVAFQDIHSGRVLAWRVDQTPNSEAVRLAAGDMIEAYGIPEHIVLDNGREFASKALTGGAPTRYRFKVREDDLPGLFVTLGCRIIWATPYSGQSKPIERMFRDFCGDIAKDPRFDGAYTGNRPEAKPEDYGSRAVELEDFLRVLGERIEEHNLREGRRSEVAYARSYAAVFDESYAQAPIRKATEAQRRLWLLGAEGLRGDSNSGLVRFMRNEYWAPWMAEIAGVRVIARFDPAAFRDGLHIYSAENVYLGHAPVKMAKGFLDMAEARVHSRARKAWMSAEKAALTAHKRLKAAELGSYLDSAAPPPASTPEAKVVRPVFNRVVTQAEAPVIRAGEAEAHEAVIADLAARRAPVAEEQPRERFRRALELERAETRGEALTAEQQRWLSIYQQTPEYRAEKMVWADFGDAIFG